MRQIWQLCNTFDNNAQMTGEVKWKLASYDDRSPTTIVVNTPEDARTEFLRVARRQENRLRAELETLLASIAAAEKIEAPKEA